MTDQLQSLVLRLEKAVQRLEQLQGGQTQAPTTGGSESAQPTSTAVANTEVFNAFNHLYADWEAKAQETGNKDIIDLTNIALHVFRWADCVVTLAATSKKPTNELFGEMSKYIREQAKQIEDNYIRPRKIENHAKAVKEGLGATFWFFTDAPASHLDGVIEPTVYSGNKVKIAKVQPETNWIDSFVNILKGIKEETKKNFTTGLIWRGKTEADFSQLLQGNLLNQGTTQTEQPKANKSFLDEINKGTDIASGLKHADRKKKGEVSTEPPLEPKKTAPTTTTKPEDKPVVKKEPKKYKTNHWFVENYTDERHLIVEEASMSESVYFDNCHKSFIEVKGKVKNIIISNCSKVVLLADTVVSSIEAMNSKGLTIQLKNHAPSVVLEKSEQVKVYLAKNLETDIVSSHVKELNISYLQDDEDLAKDFPVTEQFITRWDPKANKFVTKPLDIFM